MTSTSRGAQKALTELEKSSADFEAQLLEAATFIGITIEEAARSVSQANQAVQQHGQVGSHGKEDWLLKWLLKRLQAPKDDVPRQSPYAWNLLLVILRRLPLNISARTLVERKIVGIIQLTLDEVKTLVQEEITNGTGSSDNVEPVKKSKKRKRENTVVENAMNQDVSGLTLLKAVLAVAEFIINPILPEEDDARGAGFATEYMRNVLRVKSEEAAKLFGTWLSLIKKYKVDFNDGLPWLSTFPEIWQLHQVDENHLAHFSLYCTLPLLSLRASIGTHSVLAVSQAEQLIARNIVLPSKTAYLENAESTLFADLTKLAVISDSLNALYLFEVAIRSLQPHGIKRRRPVDEAWLQTAFKTLIGALPRKRVEQNGKAICALLKAAIKYKVDIELETLKAITSEFGLPETGETHWQLVALMIELDANVFLISSAEKDLLGELFPRLSRSSLRSKHTDVSADIVSGVVVPLMDAFAKARELTGFIQHWFAQLLIEKEFLRGQNQTKTEQILVWEDERIQKSLRTLLEGSLSTQQVLQLLDWLAEKPTQDVAAVSIILQAISGAISREEFIDAVDVRCYHILFKDGQSQFQDEETVCRSWHVLSNTLQVSTFSIEHNIAQLWTAGAQPFDSLNSTSLQDLKSSKTKNRGLALWRFACVACDIAKAESTLEMLAKNLLHDLIGHVGKDINKVYGKLQQDPMLNVDNDKLKSKDAVVVGFVIALVQTLFADHPKALAVATKDPSFKGLLQIVFWLASAAQENMILNNQLLTTSLSNSWLLALQHDVVLNDAILSDMMIDIMLEEVEQPKSQLHNSSSRDSLAVQALLQLPTVTIHRKYRERIMKSWIPIHVEKSKSNQSREIKWTAPSILALKIKMMRFPMFYDGMDFKHLESLCEAVERLEGSDLTTGLKLFGELASLTLEFVHSNLEQTRNQAYIKDAIKYISKANKSAKSDNIEFSKGSTVLYNSILQSISSHSAIIRKHDLLSDKDLAKFGVRLIGGLFAQAERYIEELRRSKIANPELDLKLLAILDGLNNIGANDVRSRLTTQCQALLQSNTSEISAPMRARLQLFLASNYSTTSEEVVPRDLTVAEYSNIDGRNAIRQQVHSILKTTEEENYLVVLKTILLNDSNSGLKLGQLLAVREMILQMKDTLKPKNARQYDSDDSSDEDDGTSEKFGLPEAYSILCGQLQKARGVRQFSLICETMATVLKTKARSITQWNIDNTIGTISIICSRHGPNLRPERADTIYLHLCQLFQTILLSHRLKLEGHFHLVVQALQALLRCLFVTLPHSSSKTLRAYPSPPWLPATPSAQSLNPSHAVVFTRLLTLICDPTVSSVTRAKHNALTSATDKAKRMAGQHMVFVLMSYVRLQLDMKMLPGMREKMTPGLYAIFDTTTVELRRSVSEGMDASGRAVFGVLYRDYLKFGKWKGS